MPVAKAIYNMVIDQPHCLHMGIADDGAKELKPTFFHIFTNLLSLFYFSFFIFQIK